MMATLIAAGAARLTAAVLVLLAWVALCAATLARERRRLRDERSERERLNTQVVALTASANPAAHDPTAQGARPPVLIAYASQTGTAESLAWHSARALGALGAAVQLLPMTELTIPRLQTGGIALFVTSTYGEGDPPDNASTFIGRLLDGVHRLDALSYAVLALGDRQYTNFCSFGHQLADWLHERGGRPLNETIEVDNQDSAALQRWQSLLTQLAPATASRKDVSGTDAAGNGPAPGNAEHVAGAALPDLTFALAPVTFTTWTLAIRERLNDGANAHPLYRLVLRPADGVALPDWQAGDLALIRHPSDPGRPREYSIASLPDNGVLELIVRQERHVDGTLGLVSGWLTASASSPTSTTSSTLTPLSVDLALRENRNFRLNGNAQRLLILIGNGSGIAGLLALIRQARLASSRGHWLIFGERDPQHDRPADVLINGWLADGTLTRADRVFSQTPQGREYVQHRLAGEAERLREAIDAGAAIYVCGSAVGMASGVQQVLLEVIGQRALDALRDAGRYRRDVY